MFDCELVGKIGSLALIRRDEYDIDYNVFSRVGAELIPGAIWISSGAVEIGRLDYIRRNGGKEIDDSNEEEINACYAAQGQSIVMENYRKFINPAYSVRQVLVEHQHFNDPEKCKFIKRLLLCSVKQNAIPIINYNDSVSNDETRKMELFNLRQHREKVVECIDNDETASEIAALVKSKYLVILTSSMGLLENPQDDNSLIKEVSGKDVHELIDNIDELKKFCVGASRKDARGMKAKLEYLSEPIKNGTTVIIGHSKYRIKDLISGNVERTIFKVR
jgi:glutamate 5-kinase